MSRTPELRQRRAMLADRLQGIIDKIDRDRRDGPTSAESKQFDDLRKEIRAYDVHIDEAEADDEKQAAAAVAQRRFILPSGGYSASGVQYDATGPYRPDTGASYFRDLHHAKLSGDPDALDRLQRSQRESRAVSTGTAGPFVPPLWAIDKFISLARPGRVAADLCYKQPLPMGVSSINLPRLATGTAVGTQGAENTVVTNVDPTTSSVSSSIVTIAGQTTISRQTLDQSPVNVDEIILQDLAQDYAQKMNSQVLNAILGTAGVNSYTVGATPTMASFNVAIAQSINGVATGRYLGAEAILAHPRRFAWLAEQADSTGRPLLPASGPMNAYGTIQNPGQAQGMAATVAGLPLYTDAGVPVNLGTGTNEDRVIAARWSDLWLYEGTPHAETFEQPYAGQLSVLCRFYCYVAGPLVRFPKAVSVISGAGLAVTP